MDGFLKAIKEALDFGLTPDQDTQLTKQQFVYVYTVREMFKYGIEWVKIYPQDVRVLTFANVVILATVVGELVDYEIFKKEE